MKKNQPKYCQSLTEYNRLKTVEVVIGNLKLGADNPIRLQSMTTTDTMDTTSSINQAIRMIDAGCEIVRYTAPSKKEAENLKEIKSGLVAQGFNSPLVADIHFTPNAAEVAADYIEKIRVNPGNYADKKKFETHEYTDESYEAELIRIREKFTPLVLKCKRLNRAMRIGTNHGSLSDRIMSRYGDTPLGMVESALEFIDICEDNGYHNLVISMKSSNALVMIQAYRLLVSKMLEREYVYPLHLGVTEAGEGEDGRIKSAVGIGTLLEDGIGDTIRVSLTEEPEFEIPVAEKLASRYSNKGETNIQSFSEKLPYNPYEYRRRETKQILNIGDHNVPVVLANLSKLDIIKPANLFAYGYVYNHQDDKWNIKDQAVDYIYTGQNIPSFELPGTLGVICDSEKWEGQNQVYPIFNLAEYLSASKKSKELNFIRIDSSDINTLSQYDLTFKNDPIVLILESNNDSSMMEMRRFMIELMHNGIDLPVIINESYSDIDEETFQLYSATDFGALLIDGFGDGIFLESNNCASPQVTMSTSFGILQATRTRISKTEYISCPSCGRTLFDLQETTAKIRAKTNHLKGLKIGIMGCIVNGPGEMADADYGYVGVGKGKINLYKEKEVVKRNIPEEKALEELILLIQEYGDWVDA